MFSELKQAATDFGFRVRYFEQIESGMTGDKFDVFTISSKTEDVFVIFDENFLMYGREFEVFLALPSEDYDGDLDAFYYKDSVERALDAEVIMEMLVN